MNAAFQRLTLISARTWWRFTFYAIMVNTGNLVLDLTIGTHYASTVGVPLSLTATGTGLIANGMRINRKHRDAQESLAIETAREAKAELERKWRADVYRVAFPDPAPDQCPICGLDDLAFFVQADSFTGDTGSAMARVVPYGPVFAHRDCAQIVPYEKYYQNTPDCQHRLGYHHAHPGGNCTACTREKGTGTKDPYPAPDGCACATCRAADTDARVDITSPDEDTSWQSFADIVFRASRWRGDLERYVWLCRFCAASVEASTKGHAQATLKTHATRCQEREALKRHGHAVLNGLVYPASMPVRPDTPHWFRCHECGGEAQAATLEGARTALAIHQAWHHTPRSDDAITRLLGQPTPQKYVAEFYGASDDGEE